MPKYNHVRDWGWDTIRNHFWGNNPEDDDDGEEGIVFCESCDNKTPLGYDEVVLILDEDGTNDWFECSFLCKKHGDEYIMGEMERLRKGRDGLR